jgi:hypothetical protein
MLHWAEPLQLCLMLPLLLLLHLKRVQPALSHS